MKYSKFAAMIITSTVAMFLMMYLNTYAISHVVNLHRYGAITLAA